MGELKVRITGRELDKHFDRKLKETACERIPYTEVYNRMEDELLREARLHDVELEELPDPKAYLEHRRRRIKQRKRYKNVRETRNKRSSG